MKKIIFTLLLLTIFQTKALNKEEAAEFLFSTLSLPDKTDYPHQFYLDNIETSFKAREEMPWGSIVPDHEFLYFVLPVRVNNETLDNSRMVFYEALKERVEGMSMEDAILEVNHWCHENVTYQPSDGRTSSPLSTVSQAIGRCGEESTLTVAALRSVGIPARQIYTPRWAHTDDNHAWVEAWANGKWYFLGACEPEPVLNLGWFNTPATRSLLMTTNIVGQYKGEEEILLSEPLLTTINVTENYAPVDYLDVEVVNVDNVPVENARVNFCIYNYNEYYPAVTKMTDVNGHASLKTGLGDMMVWATYGDKFGYSKGSPSIGKPLRVVLDKDGTFSGEFDMDIIPPSGFANTVMVTKEESDLNEMRKAREDSIRNLYTSTFITQEESLKLAKSLNLDEKKLSKILIESRGNHKVLTALLEKATPDQRKQIMRLLEAVTEKDRRDIPADAINDHVDNTYSLEEIELSLENHLNDSIYSSYILNPRIEREFIRPWRSIIRNTLGDSILIAFRKDPSKIKQWINDNIIITEGKNPQKLRMSPMAVMNNRATDKLGRKIFYVAMARTAGLPSRINGVTGNVQHLSGSNDSWIDVTFDDQNDVGEVSKGWLDLQFVPSGFIKDPKYYYQFTLSQIKDGIPQLLEFDENDSLSELFGNPRELESGQYLLTTGQRLANGSVLAHSEIFQIVPGDTLHLPLTIRKDESKLSVIGSLNAENLFKDKEGNLRSIISSAGRGYYVLGFINPNHEPSEHLLNDISLMKREFEKDGRKIILLFENEENLSRFDSQRFPGLPSNIEYGIDHNNVSQNEINESLGLERPEKPLIVVADSFNRIVWKSDGYSIGLGEKILSVLSELE